LKHVFELTNLGTELASVLDALESAVLADTGGKELAGEMRLVAEEALTNILKYAYRDEETSRADVTLVVEEQVVCLEFRDNGRAFDPLDQPPPDLDAPIEERGAGGLGIHLIKSLADEASYTRERDTNVLKLTKHR
jgi:anti-sigma regulatory factor (Ser/Thr protein kinase)